MASRRPLVNVAGATQELPAGDTIVTQDSGAQNNDLKQGSAAWHTYNRASASTAVSPASGTLYANGIHLPPNWSGSAIKMKTGPTASTGLTHSWACILNAARQVIAVSPDNTAAWLNITERTFTFGTPLTGQPEGDYYLAFVVAATTPCSVWASAGNVNLMNAPPMVAASADTGLTTPLALAATAAAFTATANLFYMALVA